MSPRVSTNALFSIKSKVKVNSFFLFALFFWTSAGLAQSPTFEWATQSGGTENILSNCIAVDNNNNVLSAGALYGTADFDPGVGTTNLSSNGGLDVYVQKLDANGNLAWAKSFGGPTSDVGRSLTTDYLGNVYVAGGFYFTVDFDPGAGVQNLTSSGSTDAYIVKLDPNGNFLWVKTVGNTGGDQVFSIITDSNGSVYAAGVFSGTVDFDPGPNTFNLTAVGGTDCYMQKLDANGNFVWAKNITSGQLNEQPNEITVDQAGNLYTVGYFSGTADFDPSPAVVNFTSNGSTDMFVQKLDLNGNYLWAKTIGGSGADNSLSISTDSGGNLYFIGTFEDTVDFDPGLGVMELSSNGSRDIFIEKLDSSGNFMWTKSIGGAEFDTGRAIEMSTNNCLFSTGYFKGVVDFDPGTGVENRTSNGNSDLYVQKLDENGNFLWVETFGDSLADAASDIALDLSGNVYTTGYFQGLIDFDPGIGVENMMTGAVTNAFVQKMFSPCCQPIASTDVRIACDSYTWINGNTYTSSTNTVTDTLMSAAGCDSIVTLDLTINTVSNVGVSQSGSVLTADLAPAAGVTYNWLNCDNGFAQVGVTTQSFTPTINGNYAVQIGESECLDTSSCFLVDDVGLETKTVHSMCIIPNPAEEFVSLFFDAPEAKLTILDLNGKVMKELTVISGDFVDLSSFEDGVYLFRISLDTIQLIKRVVKT